MQFLDDGTVSIGVNASAQALVGVTGNISIVADKYGNMGILLTHGATAGLPVAASIGGEINITNAPTIDLLKGESFIIGGSATIPGTVVGIGGEGSVFLNPDTGKIYLGSTVTVGIATPGAEGHTGIVYSEFVGNTINIFDKWDQFVERVTEW